MRLHKRGFNIVRFALLFICLPVIFSCEYSWKKEFDSSSVMDERTVQEQDSSGSESEYMLDGPVLGAKSPENNESQKMLKIVQNLEKKLSNIEERLVEKEEPSGSGKGYLSEGSTVSIGIFDEEEELTILDKVKKLERNLSLEVKKRVALEEYLLEINTEKEKVEQGLDATKKKLKEVSDSLSGKIKTLEIEKTELKEKADIAESKEEALKQDVLKLRISDTKMQQELFKYKIKQLDKQEEE